MNYKNSSTLTYTVQFSLAYEFNELIVIDFLYKGRTIHFLGFTAEAILESMGSDKKEPPDAYYQWLVIKLGSALRGFT